MQHNKNAVEGSVKQGELSKATTETNIIRQQKKQVLFERDAILGVCRFQEVNADELFSTNSSWGD